MENKNEKKFFTLKRIIILAVVILAGTVSGRMLIRGVLNLLLGGTMFGGDFLWKRDIKEGDLSPRV